MEFIDCCILVGLLEGSATQAQAFFKAFQVAGRDIPREQFDDRRDVLIKQGYVAYNPGSEDRMHITDVGRQALYAELRREPVRELTVEEMVEVWWRAKELNMAAVYSGVEERFGRSTARLMVAIEATHRVGALRTRPEMVEYIERLLKIIDNVNTDPSTN